MRAAFNEFFQSKAHTYWASNAVVSCQLHAEKQQAAAVPSWLSRAQHGICRSMIAAILHQSAQSKREALQVEAGGVAGVSRVSSSTHCASQHGSCVQVKQMARRVVRTCMDVCARDIVNTLAAPVAWPGICAISCL